jgi:hypothetical protein
VKIQQKHPSSATVNPRLIVLTPILRITLWLFNIAMENGPFIDDLPINNGDSPVRYIK